MKSKSCELIVRVADPNDLILALRNDEDKLSLESSSAEIKIISQNQIPGVGASEFIMELSFAISTGVSASLMATWIYEKVMKSGKKPVRVKGKRITLITKEDVRILIVEMIDEVE